MYIYSNYCKPTFICDFLLLLQFTRNKLVCGNKISWSRCRLSEKRITRDIWELARSKKYSRGRDSPEYSRKQIKVGLKY